MPESRVPSSSVASTVRPDEPLLLNAREVARLLTVSARTVWKLAATERLPAPVRIGRCVRWRAEELRAWVDAGCPSRDMWRAVGLRSSETLAASHPFRPSAGLSGWDGVLPPRSG
jgi:excisionase family DNA binding protein